MVKKALSNAVKNFKQRRAKEYQLSQAAAVYTEGITGYRKKKSIRDVAHEFSVDPSSLSRRIKKKGASMLEFNQTKQKLTVNEEKVLVTFILESANIGFPLSHRQIETYANAVLESKNGPEYEPVGKQWVFNFMNRHHEKLQTHWSKPLDTQRAKSLNPAAVESWFKIVEEFVVKLGIKKEDLYGMDESEFPMTYMGKERVVGGRGTKTQHKQGGANRENVTAVITICADGTTVRPLIIFKGKKIKASWGENNVSNA